MAIQIVLFAAIIILMGYIVFLQIQLTKKNIFIESTVKRLSGIEKSGSIDDMMVLLQEIKKLSQYSAYFTDKLLQDSSLNFILENDKDMAIYMHYTKEESDARSIINDGFRFAESFYRTALPVTRDKLDITIKHNSRKYYGEYLIVICIANDIVNFYSMEIEKAGIKGYSFENILTETSISTNENSDYVYLLPHQFIKGYINHRTGEIVNNPAFDPWYNSPAFMKNLELLR